MEAIDLNDLPPRLKKLDMAFKAACRDRFDVEYRGILDGPAGSFAVLLSRPGEERAKIAMSRDRQRRRLGNFAYAKTLVREFCERQAQA